MSWTLGAFALGLATGWLTAFAWPVALREWKAWRRRAYRREKLKRAGSLLGE